ncbi:MAG: 6-phosphofructokinase [Firmicutes bacterium]|nr:6-phosphofructokinase [Bacillota bacterium]
MKIGVLTSGGDAPGMNAAIRAVVRTGLGLGMKVVGIKRGFEGLLAAEIVDMTTRSVSDVINRGGTLLLTARCKEMTTQEGQEKAAGICKILGLDALVIIGGNGSFMGGLMLAKLGVNVFGIPATIDLDVDCTDYAIGFDTAINTGMEAINKIRDTSSSHERCSVVEVMGRNTGHIALWCSLAGGAEEALIPENHSNDESVSEKENFAIDTNRLIREIVENRAMGKTHNLIIVAEGIGGSSKLAREIEKVTGIETRATILGYLQRGGSPSAVDVMHASMMGYQAVKRIAEGERNKIIVYRDGKHTSIDLEEGLAYQRPYDSEFYDVMKALSV